MPSSIIFAINNTGRVFALQTDKTIWRELPYLGVDFKRVSAHDTVVWGLGGDHQVYVYVYGTSVPIRVCEEAYENQRWNPLEGFTGKLLPTDRPAFSSTDGLSDRSLSDIRLPTLAWNWEGPWHLQDIFDGKALDKECWTYAVDFPRHYTAEKQWKSCVRRRKWIRYRRYIALDTWSAVPAIHKDHTEEPFIDICVGGGDAIGEDPDKLMVWSVTALGHVMIREGTSATCPEGSSWLHIPTPDNKDVTSISVGRSGRVWAVCWDGSLLVRRGISRDDPAGLLWFCIQPPEGLGIHHIAVGVSAVWCVCRDFSVWFRKGISTTDSANQPQSISDNSSHGESWLQMVGSLHMISIGPNDQVWGISQDDHSILLRSGVTKTELTGKMWKTIHLPFIKFDPEFEDSSSTIFFDDYTSSDDSSELEEVECSSIPIPSSKDIETSSRDDASLAEMKFSTGSSSSDKNSIDTSSSLYKSSLSYLEKNPDMEESTNSLETVVSDTVVDFVGQISSEECEDDIIGVLKDKEASSSKDDSSECSSHLEILQARHESCASSIGSETFFPRDGIGSIREDEVSIDGLQLPEENLWMWLTGGGCFIQAHNLPKWFASEIVAKKSEPWQKAIFEELHKRRGREILQFSDYEEAVENTSWIYTGQCRYLVMGQWLPATLELFMIGSKASHLQEASLRISYTQKKKVTAVISICSLVLTTLTVNLPAKSIVSLYTPSHPLASVPLLFSAEKDAEQWINHISSACFQFRGSKKTISSSTIWAITSTGDVFVHDFCSSEQEIQAETKAAHQELYIGNDSLPICRSLERGFRPGCFLTISGEISQKPKRFHIDLLNGEYTNADIFIHVNPRFPEKVCVLNSREGGQWASEERSGLATLAKGTSFSITLQCSDRDVKVLINGNLHCSFAHRLAPSDVTHLSIDGDISLSQVIYNYGAGDRTLPEYYWQNVGGHLSKVETGACGITWGISYDSHVYLYTGTFNKEMYKGNSNQPGTNVMTDVRHFYIWENQRWNPLTGFTMRGLPTDRHSWSDQTGRQQKSKDGTKLPSRHWQWTSDWLVDHQTPNGVDKDGWQYATDFPMTFHSYCYATDLVRRRRWVRKACISTYGPWKQMEKVALISLSISPQMTSHSSVPIWGISVSNEVVVREGVTKSNPSGTRWTLIPSESLMADVCAGIDGGVWAISCDGQAHVRIGVTKKNPKGTNWVNVDAPEVPLKQISCGNGQVWAIDRNGSLYYRLNVQPLFIEGTEWMKVWEDVKCINVTNGGVLWAILLHYPSKSNSTAQGVLARRRGTSPTCPFGTEWEVASGTGWSDVSCRLPSEHGGH